MAKIIEFPSGSREEKVDGEGEGKPSYPGGTSPTEVGPSMWDALLRKNDKIKRKVEHDRRKKNNQVLSEYRITPGRTRTPDDDDPSAG